jgi:hypothetical protein
MSDTTLADRVIEFETGAMTDKEIIDFFQELIDTGFAWGLQGSYGRTALALINSGHCVDTR